MDARDGRVLELGQVRRELFALSIARQRGQEAGQRFEGECEDRGVRGKDTITAAGDPTDLGFGYVYLLDSFGAGAQVDLAAARVEVVNSAAIEIAERDTGNPHASCLRRGQKRFTKDLARILDRNAVEVFIQRADQNGMPEVVDGAFCLAVTGEPVSEVLVGVLGDAGKKCGHAAGDGEFV